MSPEIKDFYGPDVPSAIKAACDSLGVAQENLSIEVVETGTKGIFGLIRRKAHIRVSMQKPEPATTLSRQTAAPVAESTSQTETSIAATDKPSKKQMDADTTGKTIVEDVADEENGEDDEETGREPVELSEETLTVIKDELHRLLELMGCPATVTVENQEGTALCTVGDESESILTSQDGRTLDSLQYLLRKIISRKIPGRIQLSIDVGNYRARRHEELRSLACQYAAQVKENGKTQVIPSLNPSERRVVHVSLQDDQEIRSRSIGEGLFKKVLIYKPGKTRKGGGRKRMRGSSRKKNGPRQEK